MDIFALALRAFLGDLKNALQTLQSLTVALCAALNRDCWQFTDFESKGSSQAGIPEPQGLLRVKSLSCKKHSRVDGDW